MDTTTTTSTATTTAVLTMDLITEILLRLPAKPLARFKAVSKPFNALISSRNFILTHIKHHSLSSSSTTTHITLLSNSTLHTLHLPTPNTNPLSPTPIPTPLPFSLLSQEADLFGSCHGLLALSDFPNSLSLFNPTNLTFHVIPLPPLPDPKPESHWVDFGFGHDPFSDTYKILRVDQLNGKPNTTTTSVPRHVTIYTIDADPQWRSLPHKFPHFLTHPKGHGKYVKDSLFFMASVNPPATYDLEGCMRKRGQTDKTVYKHVIVKFHLGQERFSLVEMPVYGKRKKVNPKPALAVLGGRLAVQVEHGPQEGRMVELWVSKEEMGPTPLPTGNNWVKVLNFDYQVAKPESVRVKVVAMVGPEVLMEMRRKYCWYDVGNGGTRDVVMRGKLPERFAWFGGHPCDFGAVEFVESLVVLGNCGMEFVEEFDGGDEVYGSGIRGRMANFITAGRGRLGGYARV